MQDSFPPVSRRKLLLQGVVFVMALAFSLQIVFTSSQAILFDYVNIIIHEAGHILFVNFGQFMYVLGGSLLQITIPLSFLLYFLFFKRYFSTSFAFFWFGDSMCLLGRYIADSRAMQLALLHEKHDWNWLLGSMGLLQYDVIIGNIVWAMGLLFLFLGLISMYTMIIYEVRLRNVQKQHLAI